MSSVPACEKEFARAKQQTGKFIRILSLLVYNVHCLYKYNTLRSANVGCAFAEFEQVN